MRFNLSSLLYGLMILVLAGTGCKKDPAVIIDPPDPGPEQYGTPFDQVPATADVAMYEVNPRVFSSTRDLAGITARLDSIHALGVNVVWL
ncbi:MAG: hypothetical protein KDC54_05495, partial [Lewinella sp.]|nr:hypothetical protein [Lewinella sp.]